MIESPSIILVDGTSYLYRAYHAMFKADLRNSAGLPTGATRTVVSMLRKMRQDFPESQLVVIFDAKGKTFRDDMYSEYKANRPPMPDDLRLQIEPVNKIIKALGLPIISIEGVEADDVIGTLAKQASNAGKTVLVSTGDKDMAQLVNERVTLVNTMNETNMDCDGVLQKFGIPPSLIIDYLALMGDKVDNIPGVAGVGEKTAVALLQGLGGLDQIYANLDQVASLSFRGAKSMSKKLLEHKEAAYLSYELATIKTDVELPVTLDEIVMSEPDKTALKTLFQEYEFKTWVEELGRVSPLAKPKRPEPQYETILDKALFDQWIARLESAALFAFDTETTSLDYMEAKIVGVSFAVEPGKAAYVPFGHDYLDVPEQIPESYIWEKLRPLLESDAHKKLGQNLKYDANVLANQGIALRGIAFDTMLESYIADSTGSRHDMDALAKFYLGFDTVHFEDIAGKGQKQLTFNQISLEQAGPYAAEDADVTLQLHHLLWPRLESAPALAKVFKDIELPLVTVLSKIERNGALIDAQALGEQSLDHQQNMNRLEQEAFELAGETFNLSSTKQLGAILFEKLSLPVIKKTKKGAPSTSEEVLQELALDYPLPKVLMEYRSLSKLKSTYTDKLPTMVNAKSGRVHTSYHQAVAATGRLSSTDPNLQNIPIKTREGRRIRQAFIAPEGYKLVAADYSQIELRIMAHLSDDPGLKRAFAEGVDVHKATAAEVFDTELDLVSSEQRRSAKAINFGLIYGMSAFGLGKQLRIGRNDAKRYIDTYFERYPGVAQYMQDIRNKAKSDGYVETLLGRRLYLPDITASNGIRRQAAERIAINAPMQGTAADIIKRAMIDVDQWLEATELDVKMILQVHDELVFEVRESLLDTFIPKLSELMSHAIPLSVPLVVEAGVGDNWDQAH